MHVYLIVFLGENNPQDTHIPSVIPVFFLSYTCRDVYEASLEPYEEERHTCIALIKYLQKFQASDPFEAHQDVSPGMKYKTEFIIPTQAFL